MNSTPRQEICTCADAGLLEAYAMHALQIDQFAAVEAHLQSCVACQHAFAARAKARENQAGSLWSRVAGKIGEASWAALEREVRLPPGLHDLEWEKPGPGIHCKFLSTDPGSDRICLLVRLDPGADYPPHTHAGVEELYLLDGELWIDDRRLHPGDFNRAEPGSADSRVWSETGCTCVLITSRGDLLA